MFLVNEKRFFLLASLLRQYSELTDICSKDMRLPQNDFSLVNVFKKECELIKAGHSFGLLAVTSSMN